MRKNICLVMACLAIGSAFAEAGKSGITDRQVSVVGFVDAGGLMYYGVNEKALYIRLAFHVDKILKGTKPADIPVEQPMKFEFVINLKTANDLKLTIPQWTLMKADRVIR